MWSDEDEWGTNQQTAATAVSKWSNYGNVEDILSPNVGNYQTGIVWIYVNKPGGLGTSRNTPKNVSPTTETNK